MTTPATASPPPGDAANLPPHKAEVKPYGMASLRVLQMRRYRRPEDVAAFNANVAAEGQLVAAVLAEIDGELWVADGAARMEALKAAGETEILAWIDRRIDSQAKLVAAAVKTEERSNRHPLDLAELLGSYRDAHGLNQKEVAERLNLSPATVSRLMALLSLPADIQQMLGDNRLSLQHTIAPTDLPEAEFHDLLRKAGTEGLSARKLAATAKRKKPKPPPKLLRVEGAGAALVFARNLPVGTLRAALAEIAAKVTDKLKSTSKESIPSGELFK